MVQKYDTNTDTPGIMVPPSPMGLIITITLFVHVGKTMAIKYSAMYVDSRETSNIHGIITIIQYNIMNTTLRAIQRLPKERKKGEREREREREQEHFNVIHLHLFL